MSIAENIKKIRLEHELSQADLGKIAGVSDKAVSTWELGIKIPRMGAVEKMANYFGIPKSAILDDAQPAPASRPIPPGFEPMPKMKKIPLIGSIACGEPITAEQNIERYIGVPAAWRADFALTLFPAGDALHLIPKIGVLGIGCRRGTSAAQLEAAFAQFCAAHGLAAVCITAAASIDLKAHEPDLLEFCRIHGWPVQFFPAEALRAAPGSFTPSAFVQSVTGVDNVCERSAVLAAGGPLVFHKYARTGVTFALAVRPYAPDWRWQNV